MNEPPIMAWTVMPFKIVAKAWSDSEFLGQLLSNPVTVLRNSLWELPWTYDTIHLNQDTATNRYLPLPYLPSQYSYWTQDQVATQLKAETYGDISLQYYLPANVIARAYYDTSSPTPFITTLLSTPNVALSSMGNIPPAGINFNVYQNDTPTTLNLSIPLIPSDWQGLPYQTLLERLFAQSSQLVFGSI